MALVNDSLPGRRAAVSGHLPQTVPAGGGDDELVTLGPHPDALAAEGVRDRVLRPPVGDQGSARHLAGQPEGGRERLSGQAVQALPLADQHLLRGPAGDAVRPGVDQVQELRAGVLEIGSGTVLGQEIGVGRDQVPFGDPDGGFGAALGLGVGPLAGGHRHAVPGAEADHQRVPDRQVGNMPGGDRAFVVGQPVGGRAAEGPHRPVQTGDHGLLAAIAHRDHDPETRPGQPGAEEVDPPGADDRTGVGPVPLGRHARFGDPGPKYAAVAAAVGVLGPGHRPPHGPLRARKAHRGELAVADVGPDVAAGLPHPLLDLGAVGVDLGRDRSPVPVPEPAFGALLRQAANGQRRAARQPGRGPVGAGQVECFQYLHRFLARLHVRPLFGGASWNDPQVKQGKLPPGHGPGGVGSVGEEASDGRSGDGRQRLLLLSVSGYLACPPVITCGWPPTSPSIMASRSRKREQSFECAN